MATSAVMHGAERRGGWTGTLALIAGVLLFVVTLAITALVVVDVVARNAYARPVAEIVEILETYFAPAFAAVSLLALPAAIAASFVREGDPPLRSRSALALVPGATLALIGAAIGIVGVVVLQGSSGQWAEMTVRILARPFGDYVVLMLPMVVMMAAILGGAESPEATAAAAAPTMLIFLFATSMEVSIAKLMAGMVAPLLLLVLTVALLYLAAPARAVTPCLLGAVLPLAMVSPLASGFMTPTEATAVFALVSFLVAIPVRVLGLRQKFGSMLRQAAVETAALVAILAAGAALSFLFAMAGIVASLNDAIMQAGLSTGLVIAAIALIFTVLAYLLTPAFTLLAGGALFLPVLVRLGIDPIHAGTVLTLLGLAAVFLRSGRPLAGGAIGLSPVAARIGAAVAVGLAFVVALEPRIAMTPVRALFD